MEEEFRDRFIQLQEDAKKVLLWRMVRRKELESAINELEMKRSATRDPRQIRRLANDIRVKMIALRRLQTTIDDQMVRFRKWQATLLYELREHRLASFLAHRRDEANALLNERDEAWRSARSTHFERHPRIKEVIGRRGDLLDRLAVTLPGPRRDALHAEIESIEAEIDSLQAEVEAQALADVADYDRRLADLKLE